jgi:predicted acylesterase/phospholipase RssA
VEPYPPVPVGAQPSALVRRTYLSDWRRGADRAGCGRRDPVLETIPLAGVAVLMLGLLIGLGARFLMGGLADLKRFRAAFAGLLQSKMFPDETDRVVRMGDFARDGRPTLKIVSANLSRRSLHLFSPERTPDVPVADAVAASICLPIIFAPWRIDKAAFVDGGIVSNLPAWPFDEERELARMRYGRARVCETAACRIGMSIPSSVSFSYPAEKRRRSE